MNSSDVYEVSTKGKIKAIHNNKEIMPNNQKASKIRPSSSKYDQRRPWSNRSYRAKQGGSSVGKPAMKKTIFGFQKSHSNPRPPKERCFNYHRSKVDDIILQANTYTRVEPTSNHPMTKKY